MISNNKTHLSRKITIVTVAFVGWIFLCVPCESKSAASNISFEGTLVDDPCLIAPGGDGENVEVDFGNVPDKNFYLLSEGQSWKRNFHISLEDCDLTVGAKVKIKFEGPEDLEQPGFLALNSDSSAKHVAIAITQANGEVIPINKQTNGYSLNQGLTTLNFSAYLSASKKAVSTHTIGVGSVDATATFILEYI